jgi:hypothetical protein
MQPKLSDCCLVASVRIMVAMPCGFLFPTSYFLLPTRVTCYLCVALSSTMQPKLRDCCLVASVPIIVAMPCGFDRWNSSMS